jgi:hypothetical protein
VGNVIYNLHLKCYMPGRRSVDYNISLHDGSVEYKVLGLVEVNELCAK